MNPWTATDFEYTHGTLLWAEFRDSKPDGWKRFEVGQHIYTPRREADEPLPGERPHAGWLYVSFSALSDQLRKYTSFGISLGVTGPPALAAEMQSLIHDIFGMRDARGWSNQLPAEPTLQVRARVANVIASTTSDRRIALVAYDAAIDAATSLRARISE